MQTVSTRIYTDLESHKIYGTNVCIDNNNMKLNLRCAAKESDLLHTVQPKRKYRLH